MNLPKDLHMCGSCKRVYSDIKEFFRHKPNCSAYKNQLESDFDRPRPESLEEERLSDNIPELTLEVTIPVSANHPCDLQVKNATITDASYSVQLPVFQSNNNEGTNSTVNEKYLAKVLSEEENGTNENSRIQIDQQSGCARTNAYFDVKENTNSMKTVEESSASQKIVQKSSPNDVAKNIKMCNICSYKPSRTQDLRRHMRKHTGERPFACKICQKTFARQDKLLTHMMIHIGEKPWKCHLCDYASTENSALRKHLQTHTDERPFKCQMCSYRARNSSHMIIHLRTHTGDSPYFCDVGGCDRTFKNISDLKKHLKLHRKKVLSSHSSLLEELADDYPNKHSSKSGKLPVHISTCHTCEEYDHGTTRRRNKRGQGPSRRFRRPHLCPECGVAFVRADSLRSHIRLHNLTSAMSSPPDIPTAADIGEPEKNNFNGMDDMSNSTGVLEESLIVLSEDGAVKKVINTALL